MSEPKVEGEADAGSRSCGQGQLIFEGTDLHPVERWLTQTAVTDELSIARDGIAEITESYLDTDDGRLLRLGFCLRLTEQDGRAFAALEPIASGPGSQGGWQEALTAGAPVYLEEQSCLFTGRLRRLEGDRPLSRRIEVHGRLESISVRGPGGAECKMALEEMTVSLAASDVNRTGPLRKTAPMLSEMHPEQSRRAEPERQSVYGARLTAHPGPVEGRVESTLQRAARAVRLTLRPQPPDDDDAMRLVAELRDTCPLRPSTATRFELAVAALGLGTPGPPELGLDRIEPSQTVAEAAYALLRRHFRRMLAEEAGTRLGEDSEALHDMRVAIRRQRAALRLFRNSLPRRVVNLRERLKRIASALGEVRDLDVHLATLEECKGDLGPEDRAALDALRERLIRSRDVARRKMLRTLDAPRYARLVESMTGMLRTGPSRRFAPGRAPIRLRAPELIGKRYGRVIKTARKVDAKSDARQYHRLRIRCKALRYALEFHADLYGKPAQRMIRDLVKLQDLLGEHQDANVAATWLRGLIGDRRARLAAPTAFVAGRLAERYERRARRLRRKLSKRLKPITGRSWSRLQETMQREAVEAAARPRHRMESRRGAQGTDRGPASAARPTAPSAPHRAARDGRSR